MSDHDLGPADELLSLDEVWLENHEDDPFEVMHIPWSVPPPGHPETHAEHSPSGLPYINEPVAPDYTNDDWPKARPFQEDGHLAADDYHRRHDGDDLHRA